MNTLPTPKTVESELRAGFRLPQGLRVKCLERGYAADCYVQFIIDNVAVAHLSYDRDYKPALYFEAPECKEFVEWLYKLVYSIEHSAQHRAQARQLIQKNLIYAVINKFMGNA